ncbi:hypothetical protein ACIPSJ_09385 [Streptomyces sp. NPDC090088]|uniref:hypothetical protein n=1 Tax=Streptomyces sp. NPDC090088 TaxID=3365944 RepID=UPI00382F1FF9
MSACSNGTDKSPSAAEGKQTADEMRHPVAKVYWQLYNSIGSAASRGGGSGFFSDCEKVKEDSVMYRVTTLLGPSEKKESLENLTTAVAKQLKNSGWNLSPSSGVHRSATKNDISVEVNPSPITGTSVELQVRSKCVNVGKAADPLTAEYASASDKYSSSQASASPVPTTFAER